MDKKELDFILQEGEGLKIEFKEKLDKKLAKEIVAFANALGGRIFLGINDEGEVKGTNITNKFKSQIQDIARKCDPSIEIKLEKFDKILIIDVNEGDDKPYRCAEGFYLREGPNSQKLSRNEILKFVTGIGKFKFDEQINEEFNFPEDFNEIKLNEFLKNSNISKDNSISDILINLSLAVKKENKILLNNAGILLFGKNINGFIKQNFVYCTLFKGKDRVDIIDRKEFREDLLVNYYEALNFLKKHLKLAYIIEGGGPRKEVLELPEEALKEALVNSIIHRDYFETGFGVTIEIFDDRVEITNYGRLLFDKKELGKLSIPRNPILFDLFHRLSMIEKAGSGIGRMRKFMKKRKLKLEFRIDDVFFRIVFYRPEESETKYTSGGPLNEPLNEPLNKILDLIKSGKKVNRKLIITELGLSRATTTRYLSRLKERGIIKFVGSDKTGYYILLKKRSS